MIDVKVLNTHKKTGVLVALILLALLFAGMPAARAAPGFTLEDFTTWHWGIRETEIPSVAVGNVDGDPALEIVTGGYYRENIDGSRLTAQLSVWDGSSLALEELTTWYWTSDTSISSVAVRDVDKDGSLEIVTGGYYDDGTRDRAQLCVWSSSLSLEDVKTWYWTSNTRISSVACADVDGDGQTEIVTGGSYYDGTRSRAQLAVWDGATLVLQNVKTWYWTDQTVIRSVACADVDSDGDIEIVTGGRYYDGTRSRAQLAVWDGSTLALEDVVAWYWVSTTRISSVAVGDVDGDGSVEIVTGGAYDRGGGSYVAQLCVCTGSTLALEGVKTWYWVSSAYIYSVAIGDVDDDGDVEIVTGGHYYDGTHPHSAQLVVWGGSTLTVEGVKTWYWTGDTVITSVTVRDADSDGSTEIVTGGSYNPPDSWAQLCVWGFT